MKKKSPLQEVKKKSSRVWYMFTYSTGTFWKRKGVYGKIERAYRIRKKVAMKAMRNPGSWVLSD